MSNRKARLTRRQRYRYSQILRAAAERKPATGSVGELGDWPPCGTGRPGSSLAWAAWAFAVRWNGRSDVDVGKLLRVVLTWGSGECIYRFAMDVPGANVRRCQRAVMEAGDPETMRTFAANVPGAHAPSLEATALVAEVMGG